MVRASGPERRTMPMPPRPGGVEMATMVSCESGTLLNVIWGDFFWRGERVVFAGGFGKKCVLIWMVFCGEVVVICW